MFILLLNFIHITFKIIKFMNLFQAAENMLKLLAEGGLDALSKSDKEEDEKKWRSTIFNI